MLSKEAKNGLISAGVFGALSFISAFAFSLYIALRLISWKGPSRGSLYQNQFVILVLNLLIADILQAAGFGFSFYWLMNSQIIPSSDACFAQAWFFQIGDTSNAFFILTIAIHTWVTIVKGYQLPFKRFVFALIFIWSLAVFFSIIGPLESGRDIYTEAGIWCWIGSAYDTQRLVYHYLWIFIAQFGSVLIYCGVYYNLRKRIKLIADANHHNSRIRVNRAALYMFLYPLVYVLLTLPIASGRMYSMANPNKKLPLVFYIVVGCIFTSCGWVDSILYAATRQVLVRSDIESLRTYRDGRNTRNKHTSPESCASDNATLDNSPTCVNGATTHSVTISAANRKSRLPNLFSFPLFRSRAPVSHHASATLSPGGSQYRKSSSNHMSVGYRPETVLLKGKYDANVANESDHSSGGMGEVITQTTVEVIVESGSDKDNDSMDISSLERKEQSDSFPNSIETVKSREGRK